MKNQGKRFSKFGICSLLVIIAIMVASFASHSTATAATPAGGQSQSEAKAKLPLTILSHKHPVVIHSFDVNKNKDGHITVTVKGSGFFPVTPRGIYYPARDANGNMIDLVHCSLVTPDGSEYEGVNAETSRTGVVFSFKTSENPKTVSFYAEDNKAKKYTFDWK